MDEEILLIDKPAGISSFGVVARVRRKLSEEAGFVEITGKDGAVRRKRKKVKVGHTGTLDPFATGLLVLLIGKGTKRAGEFLKLDKEYIATLRLGATSSTGDIEGEIMVVDEFANLSSSDRSSRPPAVAGVARPAPSVVTCGSSSCEKLVNSPLSACLSEFLLVSSESSSYEKLANSPSNAYPSESQVVETVRGFVGEVEQTVPAYSAVKINGQRAYKLARAGKEVEMPRRKVKIYEIEILGYKWPELTIRCKVSSGTYIRALGEDIGKALGTGAYLTALRRTEVGGYRVEDARGLEEFEG